MTRRTLVRRNDLLFPELSYRIIGILFDVYNTLGYGHSERAYQRAVATALRAASLSFREQVYTPLTYRNVKVGSSYFDFLIEGKIILELKRGDRFAKSHLDQLLQYLKAADLKLGVLAYFAPRKLHYRRIINL